MIVGIADSSRSPAKTGREEMIQALQKAGSMS